jgi:ribosomal protein S18 acetylase RimI-like enzyme
MEWPIFGRFTMSPLRAAEARDCRFVFDVRNLLDVRQASITLGTIPYSHHVDWYDSRISESPHHLWIIEHRDNKCGYVRVDRLVTPGDREVVYCRRADRQWVGRVSIAMGPSCRGRGLGLQALRELVRESPHVLLIASVRSDNTASQRLFRRAGFRAYRDGMYRFRRRLADGKPRVEWTRDRFAYDLATVIERTGPFDDLVCPKDVVRS